jgi:hypothetical protein
MERGMPTGEEPVAPQHGSSKMLSDAPGRASLLWREKASGQLNAPSSTQ